MCPLGGAKSNWLQNYICLYAWTVVPTVVRFHAYPISCWYRLPGFSGAQCVFSPRVQTFLVSRLITDLEGSLNYWTCDVRELGRPLFCKSIIWRARVQCCPLVSSHPKKKKNPIESQKVLHRTADQRAGCESCVEERSTALRKNFASPDETIRSCYREREKCLE